MSNKITSEEFHNILMKIKDKHVNAIRMARAIIEELYTTTDRPDLLPLFPKLYEMVLHDLEKEIEEDE